VQYQTFRGADLKEALDAVKAAFGPDALIGSTSHVTNGRTGALGKAYVEVTAAPPGGEPRIWGFSEAAATPEPRRRVKRFRARLPAHAPAPRVPAQHSSSETAGGTVGLGLDMGEVERELASLRQMLEQLTATRPPRERALAWLTSLGFEGAVARDLAGDAPRSLKSEAALRSWVVSHLAGRVRTESNLIARPGPQLIACVGPTGVGKTTTLAKLAARARLEHSRPVRVISLDTYRVGAVEQWQRYSSLMGVPFHAVHDLESFRRVLAQCGSELVLVDTAGRGPLDAESDSTLAHGLAGVTSRPVHVLLVLPAWLRARDAELMVERYAQGGLTGIVLSKLDETATRGGVLHAALPSGLPLTYLCDGPRVPEDVHEATPDNVIEAVFPSAS
jgi:flagellar biosynthesis protein FlhF